MSVKSEVKLESETEKGAKTDVEKKPETKTETKVETKPAPAAVAPPAAVAQPRPLIVTSTTPDGKLLQYQLNQARSVLVNAQSVNFPISANQVYYLQMEVNGQVVATPHLMCGTTMKNGCMYYCMTPMVLISSSVKSWSVC